MAVARSNLGAGDAGQCRRDAAQSALRPARPRRGGGAAAVGEPGDQCKRGGRFFHRQGGTTGGAGGLDRRRRGGRGPGERPGGLRQIGTAGEDRGSLQSPGSATDPGAGSAGPCRSGGAQRGRGGGGAGGESGRSGAAAGGGAAAQRLAVDECQRAAQPAGAARRRGAAGPERQPAVAADRWLGGGRRRAHSNRGGAAAAPGWRGPAVDQQQAHRFSRAWQAPTTRYLAAGTGGGSGSAGGVRANPARPGDLRGQAIGWRFHRHGP